MVGRHSFLVSLEHRSLTVVLLRMRDPFSWDFAFVKALAFRALLSFASCRALACLPWLPTWGCYWMADMGMLLGIKPVGRPRAVPHLHGYRDPARTKTLLRRPQSRGGC